MGKSIGFGLKTGAKALGIGGKKGPTGVTIPEVDIAKTTKTLKGDIKAGQELFGGDFQEGKLGRLETGPSSDVQDIIARRKAGLEGLSAEENQSIREKGSQSIDRSTQSSLRQLRGIQGASGQRGGSAVANQARILQAGQGAKANVERDLAIQNIGVKRDALGAAEGSILGAEAQTRENTLFNINQKNKEASGRQAAGLSFAQLAATERGSQRGVGIAQANARAAGGGGKK